MAKTLANVRTRVRRILDETTAGNWADSDLNVVINERYHRVYTAQCAVEKDYNVSVSSVLNLVISQQEYQSSGGLPTDIFKIRRVEINYDSANTNSVNQRAYPLFTIDSVRDRLANSTIGLLTYSHPNYYYIGGKLGFIPIPDKTGTFQVWYYPVLSDLSSDSDSLTLFYPDRYFNIVAIGAAADALRFGQLESVEADKLDQKFIAEVILMQEEMEDRIAEEGRAVVDVTGDTLDFSNGY
jgi:hypothetical protein